MVATLADWPQLKSSDSLLPKPDRAGSLPRELVNGAGRGRRWVVRGCPLETGQDRCEWHGSGTAGENDDAHTYERRLSGDCGARPVQADHLLVGKPSRGGRGSRA
jgi:hypothetical protein